MLILAIDTSGPRTAVVLRRTGDAPETIAQDIQPMERGHAEALLPAVAGVMTMTGVDWPAIGRIAVISGPGSFTGVRIGVAAARGLALASGAAAVGFSALVATARSLGKIPPGGILIANDARRGQVFAEVFAADGTSVCAAMAASPDTVIANLPASVGAVAGTGSAAITAAARGAGRLLTDIGAPAIDLGVVADMAAKVDPATHPAVPLYLRPPDAKPQGAARIARAGDAP